MFEKKLWEEKIRMSRPTKLTIPLMIIALILTVYFVDQEETKSDDVIPVNTVDSVWVM